MMGAWGMESFENDGAGDFLAAVVHSANLDHVHEAFQVVLANNDYIEVDDAQAAVAAGEIVALLLDLPGKALPQKLLTWLQTYPQTVEAALTEQAIQAVRKVYTDSEMRELWEDVPDFPAWESSVLDLIARLESKR
jgi:hypothetical protein